MFIVVGARYIGDPEASVYSFGETDIELRGLMSGRVDTETRGTLSSDTSFRDGRFWRELTEPIEASASPPPLPPTVSPIIADENTVRWYAENVVLDRPYSINPDRDEETNSNSVSWAVANRASEAGEVPLPEGRGALGYWGANSWRAVNFAGSMP